MYRGRHSWKTGGVSDRQTSVHRARVSWDAGAGDVPRVRFETDPGGDRVASLHRRAHERCFITNSVNFPVEVEPRP